MKKNRIGQNSVSIQWEAIIWWESINIYKSHNLIGQNVINIHDNKTSCVNRSIDPQKIRNGQHPAVGHVHLEEEPSSQDNPVWKTEGTPPVKDSNRGPADICHLQTGSAGLGSGLGNRAWYPGGPQRPLQGRGPTRRLVLLTVSPTVLKERCPSLEHTSCVLLTTLG